MADGVGLRAVQGGNGFRCPRAALLEDEAMSAVIGWLLCAWAIGWAAGTQQRIFIRAAEVSLG